jgi:hypothetical protein
VDLEGLRLRAFDDTCVKAHPSVIDFYRQIGYGEDAVEQLTGDKELIKTDIVKLSQMFKLKIPRATDYKNDQVWIQGGNGNGHNHSNSSGGGGDQQQQSERGFHTGSGAATNDFQRFDNDFTDATRGWQSQHKRVGPYANFESMMQSSLPSEEFTNRRLENAAAAAQPQRNRQGYGRAGASSSSSGGGGGGGYNQGGGGGTYSQYNNNSYSSGARVPFKDESSTELEPSYTDSLKAQKQSFLSRPGRSLPPSFATGVVTSFVASVPVPAAAAAAAPTNADAAPKRQLTEEQRARIEANKRKAMQKKMMMLHGAAGGGGGHEPVVDLTGGGASMYRGL